jgi:hypothetical protein
MPHSEQKANHVEQPYIQLWYKNPNLAVKLEKESTRTPLNAAASARAICSPIPRNAYHPKAVATASTELSSMEGERRTHYQS